MENIFVVLFSIVFSLFVIQIFDSFFSGSNENAVRTNGKASAGLIGKIRGKVGNVIFSVWKGEQVIKEMFVPANPKTEKQNEVRFSIFSQVVRYCQSLLCYWNTYWNASNFSSKTTPYSSAMGKNLRAVYSDQSGDNYEMKLNQLTLGTGGVNSLPSTAVAQAGADVNVTWDDNLMTFEEFCGCYNPDTFKLNTVVVIPGAGDTVELVLKFEEEFDETLYDAGQYVLTGLRSNLFDQFGAITVRVLVQIVAKRPEDDIVWSMSNTINLPLSITDPS